MFCTWIVKKSKLSLFGTFALMPRGWMFRLKKYHDLEIWPWPTCRSILGDGTRKKNIFQTEVFFLQTCKYSFFWKKYKGIKMPRGWISRLKKINRPWNLHTTYLSRYSRRWYSPKKNSPTGSIFFSNLQTWKYRFFVFGKKYRHKNAPRLDISL